jgi:UDP-N-acetylmuramate: L-alanyl-gamma-D-glutamyl-meso-diaminopimelate ligase
MHFHLVGVCGKGMRTLAVLLREAGHDVSGSDVAFDPPVGPALEAAGVRCLRGWDPAHLDPPPDRVIVGGAIREDNPEARAALARDLPLTRMSRALREQFLLRRRPLVVTGTHETTTTAAMCAHLLIRADRGPGWFLGGVPRGLPSGGAIGRATRSILGGAAERAPFVVEADPYDDVHGGETPPFLDYAGVGDDDVAILTRLEREPAGVYPTEAALRSFVRALPSGGLLVVCARGARARAIAREESRARVVFYALEGDDTGDVTPTWQAAPAAHDGAGNAQFDLFAGGMSCGRYTLRAADAHDVRNAVAAIAACAEGFGVDVRGTRGALASFLPSVEARER